MRVMRLVTSALNAVFARTTVEESATGPKMITKKLVRMYHKGVITERQLLIDVLEQGDPQEIDDLGEFKEKFLKNLDRFPVAEQDWSKVVCVGSCLNTGNEESKAIVRKNVERWRKALKKISV
jgi:hypothetical protein